ncbi:hypothetical protein TRVL_01091 [Trypanosoma vivax]|nr:hypothetical protein TRVL_01091 [Trypanosoma vivax]
MNCETVDLRQSWRTFLVPQAVPETGCSSASTLGAHSGLRYNEYSLLQRHRVVGTSNDEQSLFFLSLISPNEELLRATGHLFIQLNSQYRQLVEENEEKVSMLRTYHEEQLADLLEVTNTETHDIVVASEVTERFVLRHQQELEELQRQNIANELSLLSSLRQSLLVFLKTSAYGTMDALAMGDGRMKVHGDTEQPKRAINIAYFVSTPVPVRTVELPNILRQELKDVRPKDPLLRNVVIDISPLSYLQPCLQCLYSEEQNAELAVEEHLLRLSRQCHAVLFLIGSEVEAKSLLTTNCAELLLTPDFPSSCDTSPRFVPLNNHQHLKIFLSTRLWGANIVFLWTPPSAASEGQQLQWSTVRDALHLAHTWNADMFSVAVLRSASLFCGTLDHDVEKRAREASMEVLRQLQHGVARLAYEAAAVKVSAMWGGAEEAQQQQMKYEQQWDDGQTIVYPVSAKMPQIEFNVPISIRVFLPISIDSQDDDSARGASLESTIGACSFPPTPEATVARSAHSLQAENDSISRRSTGDIGDSAPIDGLRVGLGSVLMRRSSFSGDSVASRDMNRQTKQHMSFERLLVYNFGEFAVVH